MKKVPIKASADADEKIYEHLMPIISYALEQGCTIVDATLKNLFTPSPNGLFCNLLGEVTMKDIQKTFELPDTILIGGPHDSCLWDKNSNIKLCIYSE